MQNFNKHKYIPYGQQWIEEDDIQAVVEVLRGDYLTTGPKINEFEKSIANYVDAQYAVAVSNGTAALHAACYAVGIGKGDEVITSPITFAASANCVLYMGAKPVFVDVDPNTYNIDVSQIKSKITNKTKAIIPVHFTGQACDMDEIIKIANDHNLAIIEDGAHALGTRYKEQMIGSIGDMTTFSFHPVKHITTGEGGAITTNNKKYYDKLCMFRTHGITRDNALLTQSEGSWYYEQQFLGYNYRMTDIQAALGISRMSKIEKFLDLRRKYAKKYDQAFKCVDGIIIPQQSENTCSAWHLYIIKLELEKLSMGRKVIFEELQKRNIGANVHYIPVYYHPYYQKLGYKKGECPQAENLYEQIITLPLYPKMAESDVDYVIENVKEVIDMYKKY